MGRPPQTAPPSHSAVTSLGPVHRGYDLLDLADEARRELEYRHDGPIPPWERRAAEALISRRQAMLKEPDGKVRALRADIASLEARIALHRRQLRLDVRSFRRRLTRGQNPTYARLAMDHDKGMLRLLIAKLDAARAMLATLSDQAA